MAQECSNGSSVPPSRLQYVWNPFVSWYCHCVYSGFHQEAACIERLYVKNGVNILDLEKRIKLFIVDSKATRLCSTWL